MHLRLHKAPVDSRKMPDFLQYASWERQRYPGGPERRPHVPSEKKLSEYYKINGLLRTRLCKCRSLPASDRKEALIEFIHTRLEENMAMIFHEREPGKWPNPREKFTFGEKKTKMPVIRLLLPAPQAEPAFMEYAHAV